MTSPTLITLALLQANWDSRKDYLANFEPFLLMELQRWDVGAEVESARLSQHIQNGSGIALPVNVTKSLVKRAARAGFLSRDEATGKLYVVPEKLEELEDLSLVRTRARNSIEDLIGRLQRYAQEHHELNWTAEEADAALSAFLDEMGLAFLVGRRRGEAPQPTNGAGQKVAVVQAFARHAFDDDERSLSLLEQAVHGSMLATVLHYERPEDAQRRLGSLVVYLDTPIVLRLLGVSLPQLSDAAVEMRDLLREHEVPCRVFRHTVEEVRGVLASTAANLRTSRSKAHTNTRNLSRTQREVLDHFVAEGRTAGDVETLSADLDQRLLKLGLNVDETPDHVERLTIDETKLADALQETVGYKSQAAKQRDIESLTAVHRLREGRSDSELGRAKAVFVTSNTALARCTRSFMRTEEHTGGVPHILSDIELTTQVWVRTPSARPDLPRKLLIADAYAALNPPPKLWDKYLTVIERLQQSGQVSEEQVAGLIHSMSARSEMVDLSLGDPNAVDEETVGEVLARLTDRLAGPLVEEERQRSADAQRASEAQIAQLEQRLATQGAQLEAEAKNANRIAKLESDLADHSAELAEERKQRLAREKRAKATRHVLAFVAASLLTLGGVLVVLLPSWDTTVRALAAFGFCALAAGVYGLERRDLKKAGAAFLATLAVLGAVFAIYSLPPKDSEKPKAPATTTNPS